MLKEQNNPKNGNEFYSQQIGSLFGELEYFLVRYGLMLR